MKIHIIGLGNFGLFLARHFKESGLEVTGFDVSPGKTKIMEELAWCPDRHGFHPAESQEPDVVVLAVFPKQITEGLVKKIEDIAPDALIVNVSSVQQLGISTLVNTWAGNMMSFHPLFGPVGVTKSGWAGKQIIVTVQPEKDDRALALLETFTRRGVTVDKMSAEEHDRKMLPHALAFFIAELVKAGTEGTDPRFLTGSGRQMIGLLDFTEGCSEDLRSLVLSNPELKKIFPKLRDVFEKLTKGRR